MTDLLMTTLISTPIKDPVPVFLMILGIMLIAPLLFEKIRLPGIVGLILAGVVVGPNGLGLLARDNTIVLLGTVGLLFLMFMAGLETSLDDMKYNADKAVIFGLATFLVPMVLGTGAMMAIGYDLLPAVLVASCFASHTLLALPVASKLGIMRSQVMTTTLGGTLITNIFALLVLAVVVRAHEGNLTLQFWLFLIPSLIIYTFLILWGLPRLGRWFFQRFGHDEGAEFTFVLASLFVVSYAAELIQIEPIIGAFLAGVAITQLIPQLSPLMNRIQFIGNTLFVPFFLISVGMLVNPMILIQEPRSLVVSGVMVTVALGSKFIPAWGAGKLFGFNFDNIMVMFGLSVAQAASTLAAITVAYNIELVDQLTVNGTIAMILVTCVASPWVTAQWGQKLKPGEATTQNPKTGTIGDRVLVPVANPRTEDNLLQLAILLAKSAKGTLLPLHILLEQNSTISPEDKTRQNQLLSTAEMIAHAAVTNVTPIGRIDESIDKGIARVAEEQQASVIVCGWKGYSTYEENLFGGVIDKIVNRSSVPVLVSRFPLPIEHTGRVFIAFTTQQTYASSFKQSIELAKSLATELKATLQLLHVVAVRGATVELTDLELPPDTPILKVRGNFVRQVSRLLKSNDLLVLNGTVEQKTQLFSLLGHAPEAIARSHPEVAMIIAYFPQ
ncbi:cation:proton antiporter [Nodularia spumigena CS-588/02]|uniref:Cation:proton antiporter n=1 Tax=Nodularia spumigena CENA596 TaxID=1819295 RepID=A0A166IGG5_NODSP|nr:cation:proton antiporter [Nodularia spumigena]KZL48370.1 cation:proton antiporter [Nodularia spumigena CENA596]MDB9349572.1 cation:proton antiporter [Nodularia spumigena CS-588/01]MDB9350938.1 cation:proton antiporter [Nodularia spumigena CS-588/05]MDB9360036.1 cation:proton antiporter [Nodularia spumigena CS-588/02]MDB9364455.1 cation:proton antiporter [Nodularia spumigena CS-588/02A10]